MKNIKLLFLSLSLVFAFVFSASAQDVTFTSLGGEKIDLASEKGKVVVLAIGASWLPLSKNQATAINKLTRKYNGRDVAFYFIATDSTAQKSKNYASNEQIQKFAESNKLTISILRDSEGALSIKQYKVDQLPAFIILDKEGRLADGPFTGLDPNSDISIPLSAKIDKLL
ncbi:MAG TPA: TlpA disulfide reductase family protein [Pyrinomonadaceae bacterium]|jgi:peroxiredoxin